MTTPDQSKGDRSRDEVLAGEYVLGVLGQQARRAVEARIRHDRNFAAVVARWEQNLSNFNDDYVDEIPAPAVLAGIESRLFPGAGVAAAGSMGIVPSLWNSLVFWRTATVATVLFTAGFIGFQLAPGLRPASPSLVAEMAGQDNSISLVARYDGASGRLRVTPVAAGKATEKSLELWLIVGSDPPMSLGVLPQSGEGEIAVPAVLRGEFSAGVTLAVSLEPYGGSPTGQATGPIVALGATHF